MDYLKKAQHRIELKKKLISQENVFKIKLNEFNQKTKNIRILISTYKRKINKLADEIDEDIVKEFSYSRIIKK